MKAFLLAERFEMPYGDGMLVAAQDEAHARNVAATTAPKLVAPDGKNLWESNETACVELGELPPEASEGAIMKGSILFACAPKNGKVYPLRLAPNTQTFSQAL